MSLSRFSFSISIFFVDFYFCLNFTCSIFNLTIILVLFLRSFHTLPFLRQNKQQTVILQFDPSLPRRYLALEGRLSPLFLCVSCHFDATFPNILACID